MCDLLVFHLSFLATNFIVFLLKNMANQNFQHEEKFLPPSGVPLRAERGEKILSYFMYQNPTCKR